MFLVWIEVSEPGEEVTLAWGSLVMDTFSLKCLWHIQVNVQAGGMCKLDILERDMVLRYNHRHIGGH